MSWVFIYFFTLLGLLLVVVAVSFVVSYSVEAEVKDKFVSESSWMW